jgi:ribosomal-protein-alanine N-acetyltransferase
VHPQFRRQGIGKRILKELIEIAASKGAGLMTLEVRENNEAARQLYEKTGFRLIAIRKGYYVDTNEDAYVYLKDRL